MSPDDINKLRRTELLARLALLDRWVEEHTSRVEHARIEGLELPAVEEALAKLKETHRLHFSALKELLDDGSSVARSIEGG